MMNENGMEVSAGQALDSEPKGKRSSRRNRGGHSETGVSEKVIKQRDHWANQLCTPEWMLTVPSDLDGAGNPVGAGEHTAKFLQMILSASCVKDCHTVTHSRQFQQSSSMA